jgi:hypothetical protein
MDRFPPEPPTNPAELAEYTNRVWVVDDGEVWVADVGTLPAEAGPVDPAFVLPSDPAEASARLYGVVVNFADGGGEWSAPDTQPPPAENAP